MSKIRPKRTIAHSSLDFCESSQFQNGGYIKVMELISHVVIERNYLPTATTDETRKQQNLELMVSESVCTSKKCRKNTNYISKDLTKKKPRLAKRDKIREWFKKHLLNEEIEILSHKKQLSSIDEDQFPSNILVGCSRELSKPESFQNFEKYKFFR
ncbi:CPG_1a_G0017040.mRNA.1.CDS.1 [Saccharomyces cerevisiae]|uniref:Uncharacterized protein n=1 Tax=Saccharomyces paradoxus TaxID=27291 RepID=A0A8B8UQM7_SACPA|nr:uncharacterized protein SPAR_F00500 [Saccharomyces paradoxus]QHS73022.1 hypothetical protein SPAR_F00500 [Saccharomyces paradoxus]CAI4431773.1 CPG_1a_G0017040.mRNA.1.CDS.1 [Saccharomyces cerevisiae]CAI7276222.1 CPG_1a_G0017040.mRNA.1.CDS.1 [Saccharomyces cerevisiae]